MELEQATILVADDEPFIRAHVVTFLRRMGCAVLEAADGHGALDKARLGPDLILLDVAMPGMDGLETAAALRKNEKTRDIPILMFSAKAAEDDISRGLEAGADEYVTKPAQLPFIAQRIRNLLQRYG